MQLDKIKILNAYLATQPDKDIYVPARQYCIVSNAKYEYLCFFNN